MTPVDANNPDIKTGGRIYGYTVKRAVALKETRSFFYELNHTATGARHVHISNDDAENTFSVAFKTVPADSTGVAHILEHTVLCGSKKFPVRDPFFSMLKRSLSTFMNAFTASDWTMYPFSTQNKKDFYNLLDVYLDAVFFPNLNRLNFKQEGHRLEIEKDPKGFDAYRLQYKGVVFNEMKGAMSSPDQVMVRSLLHALYPSTTYRYNSGGDPAIIPSLSYGQLKAFHQRHYHPSNSYFYTYGNLPLKEHLAFIQNTILKHYDFIDPQTEVPAQPRWTQPKTVAYSYPLGKNENPAKKYQGCVGWLTTDINNTLEVLVLTLLEQILIGNAASPLRKALVDSGLGSALSDGTGFDADNRDTLFAAGLKDIEKASVKKIETILLNELQNLASRGIDKKLIESAIHQIEFHRKEIINQPYPYGIRLLLSFAGSWIHGGDPVRTLQFDEDLEKIRNAAAAGRFFENRIKKYFLDNPHRVLLTLTPDQSMEDNENKRAAAELEKIKAGMTPDDLKQIQEDTEALTKLQETPEDLSSLPTLALTEIPPTVKAVLAASTNGREQITSYQQPTAGIFYLTAAIGTGILPQDLVPLVPFFCYVFAKVGTTRRDYTEMARLIDAYTGGIGLTASARTSFESSGNCLSFISLNSKCLERNRNRMFEILSEFIHKFDFGDRVRLKNLLLEYRANLELMIVHNGHRLAMSLASRNFSPALALEEKWHGIHQLINIKKITADLTNDHLDSISEDLSVIAKYLLTDDNMRIALIGEDTAMTEALAAANTLYSKLAKGNAKGFEPPPVDFSNDIPREGWATSTAVSFVARTFQTVRMEHRDAPALSVISKMLRSLFLHRELREKGGAYGGFALYNPENGLFGFGSYRDPHILATLKAYDRVPDFIRTKGFTDEDIKEATLQVCAEIDKPDPPGPAAVKAFYRTIISLSDDARNRFKHELLSLTRHRVMDVAEKYFHGRAQDQAVAVISGETQLKTANEKLKSHPLKIYLI